jgi:1-deoxy-D-xylulose-5-phosphate reductoisomerase
MGAKISVDSATMMNKGLEFIEAFHLFPVGVERLRIWFTRSRSSIRWSNIATARRWRSWPFGHARADRLAAWPAADGHAVRAARSGRHWRADVPRARRNALPATRLAREAVTAGGAAPAVLNAANEIAVAAFLEGRIGFTRIVACVERAGSMPPFPPRFAG